MRYHFPIDPDCPVVREYMDTLFDDPMTEAMGAPTDDIVEFFRRRHIQTCDRCRKYGVDNVELSGVFYR